MNRLFKGFYKLLAGLFLIGIIGLIVVMALTSQASEHAENYLDNAVIKDNVIHFEVSNPSHSIIFYPGGFVEAESYAYLASMLQEESIEVFIVKMPLNLAAFNRFAYEAIIENYDRDSWVLMGHSLGGAMMSYVEEGFIDYLIFLAAYPPSSVDLSDTSINVLSVTASEDLVINWGNYESTKTSLPTSAVFASIKGGNHAGFGHYGNQRGDGDALISKSNQHVQVVNYIIDFLNE